MVTPDLDKEIRVKANTSNFAMEGVLLMKCENKRWRLVAYISKSLNEAKKIMKFTIKRYWQLLDV